MAESRANTNTVHVERCVHRQLYDAIVLHSDEYDWVDQLCLRRAPGTLLLAAAKWYCQKGFADMCSLEEMSPENVILFSGRSWIGDVIVLWHGSGNNTNSVPGLFTRPVMLSSIKFNSANVSVNLPWKYGIRCHNKNTSKLSKCYKNAALFRTL